MADHEDPLVSFHFAVDIQGVVQGFFTECSGLGSETEIVEQNSWPPQVGKHRLEARYYQQYGHLDLA